MVLRFNERRATEAAARFLKLRGGRMSYLKLIKLLYLLDREALLQWGRPVTTDRYIAMDNGPVVSRIYDLIREESAPGADPIWRHYISAPQEWEVTLLAEPETEELSRAEKALIEEIFTKFGSMNRWDLVRISHDLPEWQDPRGSAIPIQYRTYCAPGTRQRAKSRPWKPNWSRWPSQRPCCNLCRWSAATHSSCPPLEGRLYLTCGSSSRSPAKRTYVPSSA